MRQLMREHQPERFALCGQTLRQQNDRSEYAECQGRAAAARGADAGRFAKAKQIQQRDHRWAGRDLRGPESSHHKDTADAHICG